ncbi:hypothetical protein MKZ38_002843 [Zalerion maritima]|uniref:Uncharacterized protein n=1 Tax=Zalerion maritima TaxID=339359 RepID=A0AAD5WUP6_9PEZI|nr:hypothetical protein MKZ38_002843 [Zalerion maritima]
MFVLSAQSGVSRLLDVFDTMYMHTTAPAAQTYSGKPSPEADWEYILEFTGRHAVLKMTGVGYPIIITSVCIAWRYLLLHFVRFLSHFIYGIMQDEKQDEDEWLDGCEDRYEHEMEVAQEGLIFRNVLHFRDLAVIITE